MEAPEASKPPLLSRRLTLFMVTMVLANVAVRMHDPLMPLYVQELGAGVAQVAPSSARPTVP